MTTEKLAQAKPILSLKQRKINISTGKAQVTILAKCRGGGFQDIDVERSHLANLQKLHATLVDHDVAIPVQYYDAKPVLEKLQAEDAKLKSKIYVANTCGWYDYVFVTPFYSCGSGKNIGIAQFFDDPDKIVLGRKQGSLEEFLKLIKPMLLYSRVARLLVGAQCASILAGIVDIGEPAIFHISGLSGRGKTVAIRTAMAMVGRANRNDVSTYSATEAGLQDQFAFYRNTLTVIDELATAEGDDRAVYASSVKLAHKFASRRGTKLSDSYAASSGKVQRSWNQMGVSSGEKSIQHLARAAGKKIPEGVLRRLIDLPIENSIFDTESKNKPETVAEEQSLLKALADGIKLHHGIALPTLVNWIVENPEFVEGFEKRRMMFNNLFKPDASWKVTFVDKFAVCFAAGCLGIEAGIIPCEPKSFRFSIKKLCQLALDFATQPCLDTGPLLEKLNDLLTDSKLMPILSTGPKFTKSDRAGKFGFRKRNSDGQLIAFIFGDKFEQHFPNSYELNFLLSELKAKKLLLLGSGGKSTQPKAMPGGEKPKRCYRVILEE